MDQPQNARPEISSAAELIGDQLTTGAPAAPADAPPLTDEQTMHLLMSALTARLKPEVKIALILFLPGEGEGEPPYCRLGATVDRPLLRAFMGQLEQQWALEEAAASDPAAAH